MAAGRTLPDSLKFLVFLLTTASVIRENSTGMPFADTNLISLKPRAKRFLTCRVQYTSKGTSSFNLMTDVLVCGDIQANPGPRKTKLSPKYPCSECEKPVRNNQDAILCAGWNKWSHAKCLLMSHTIFQYYLSMPDIEWTCSSCALPPLSDSFFAEDSGDESLNKTFESEVSQPEGLQRRVRAIFPPWIQWQLYF